MATGIQAIFIDLGGTLRVLIKDQEHMASARRKIAELVGTDEDPLAFVTRLDERMLKVRQELAVTDEAVKAFSMELQTNNAPEAVQRSIFLTQYSDSK